MSQGTNRVIVVRVRGLPQDHSAATTLEAAIDCSTENYKVTILPSCDRLNESVALVDFKQKLPPSLASLESDRLTPWQISIDDKDLSFDQNFLGFTQLYPTRETIQADIIAVCGVDGHAYGSWQGRGPLRRMWLRHFLCKDLPSCRTMVYGYKAKLSSKDSATIEDYAKDFLEALRRIRQNVPVNRPIIFIAHSFGGLVIARAMIRLKQALVTSEAALASIYDSICGILFFAVPFRGIDVEDMSRIMEAQSHPRASLLKHFSVGSGDLKKQFTEFIDLLYGLKVVSFFETEQSRRLVRNESGEWQRSGEYFTTLEADSAVLHLPQEMETRIALHSDHSGIVKFDDKYDAGYEYATKFLQSFLENNNKGMLQKQKLHDGSGINRQLYMSQEPYVNYTSSQQASTSKLLPDETAYIWQFTTSNKASNNIAHSSNNNRLSIQPLETQSRSKDDNDCLAKLAAADPRLEKKRIQSTKGGLLKGSYYWILENEQYQRWHNSQNNGLLWVRGDPGKGKTMLLCGIIDEFDRTQPMSYFFCQATDNRLNRATSVLRGLIYMLVDQYPSTISHWRQRLERGSISEGADAWWVLCDVLEDMFKELKNVSLLVDALDECEIGRDDLIQFVSQTSSSTEYQAKWIVSSRNWADIRNSLYGASNLSLELNAESVSSAVIYYIQYKVNNLAAKKSYDGITRDYILEYLLANAKGTFLWVALVCTNLEKAKSWNARQTVVIFPPNLEQVYEHMMRSVYRSSDSEHYQQVLATVANVYRPVSLAELQTLVDLPKEITDTIASFRDFIDDCGSFLTVQDNRIEFVHQSAKDFVDGILEKQGLSRLRNLHLSILVRSIGAMSRILKKDNYGLKDPSLDVSCIELPSVGNLPGIHYACLYWTQHLEEFKLKPTESHLIDMLFAFIRDKFLYWLEAVSLIHSVWYAISLMHELQLHFELHSEFKGLRDLAYDSYRFAQYFRGGIVHNPLQIYVSGMLFSPKQSAYRKQLIREKPSWLELRLNEQESWPSIITRVGDEMGQLGSVVYSCDGKRIVTKSLHSDELHVWDTVSGAQIRRLTSQPQDISEAPSHYSTESSESPEDDGNDNVSKPHSIPAQHNQTSRSSRTPSEDQGNKISNFNLDPAFAPGNDKIYYTSLQGRLMSWDVQTGEEMSLSDLDFSMFYHAISSDGMHVAYIADGQVSLYSIDSQTRLLLLQESDSFDMLAFSSNGTGLCASSSTGSIAVWNIRTKVVIGSVDVDIEAIDSLALANNLKFLSVASEVKGLVEVIAIGSGSTIWQWVADGNIAFSFDSLRLACGSGFSLRIYNVSDGSSVTSITSHMDAIAFSPDCRQLAHGTFNGFRMLDLTMFDRDYRSALRTRIVGTCYNHKSSQMVVQRDDRFEFWDLKRKALVWEQLGYFAPGGSGNRIVATIPGISRPAVWHFEEDSAEAIDNVPDFENSIGSIFLAPDDTRALVATSESGILIWDLETGVLRSLDVGTLSSYSSDGIHWDTGAQRISFTIRHDIAVVFDTLSGNLLLRTPVYRFNRPYDKHGIHLSSSGKIFACVDSSSSIAFWDVDSGRQVGRIEASSSHYTRSSICLSKDDQYFAVTKGSSLEIFDIATNSLLQKVDIHQMIRVTSFFRSGDSMTIFTSDGCMLVEGDGVVLGMDDRLFESLDWLYRRNRKLIWVPSRPAGEIKFHGDGAYAVEMEDGGFAVFRTRFDSTGLNEV